MSRINSAQQPLFAIAAPIWQGLRESIGRYLPKTELLRRTVPVLIAIFASLAAIGLVTQTLQSRQSAFSLAEERLALMADLTAVRLKDEALKPDGNWQAALAASLPKGATQDERTALLADADGNIKARAPMMTSENASLLAVLGPQQPLTTFGASAGVLRHDAHRRHRRLRNGPRSAGEECASRLPSARARGASQAGGVTRASRSRS